MRKISCILLIFLSISTVSANEYMLTTYGYSEECVLPFSTLITKARARKAAKKHIKKWATYSCPSKKAIYKLKGYDVKEEVSLRSISLCWLNRIVKVKAIYSYECKK